MNVVLLLAACSQEWQPENEALPEGAYPLQIKAVVSDNNGEGESRVAENSYGKCSVFEVGDQFCVRFIDVNKAGIYRIKDNTGAAEPVNAIYWTKTKTEMLGWYPQESTVSLADQSSGLAYVLRAEPTTFYYYKTEPYTLTFTNRLSKVRVAFYYFGVDESTNTITDVRIKSYTQCSHNEGKLASPSGTATQDYIAMHEATYNGVKYWEANLVPGTLVKTDALKYKRNGKEETRSFQNDVVLEAGKMSFLTIAFHTGSYNLLCLDDVTQETRISEKTIIYGTTSYKIRLLPGAEVVLLNATLNGQIVCDGDAKITLCGKNIVTSPTYGRAGLQLALEGYTITIDGNGQLYAEGAPYGPGIGGSEHLGTWGSVVINGGEITAIGGVYGAGIGSAEDHDSGSITINGGVITAIGNSGGAGIGSSRYGICGDILINGGVITAIGGEGGAGIGCGMGGTCGAITFAGVNGMRVNAGSSAACIGYGSGTCNVGAIKVTGSTITLDNSASGSTYFNPNPTDITGSTFYDQNGNVITPITTGG